MCGGVDPRCSTAYSCLWSSTGSLAAFLAKYAPGPVDRVAFAGFSAAHGFLNPLMHSAADRAGVSALILFDASFGGGKTGYEKAVEDAANGKMLLVATTGVTGGDASWSPVWKAAEDSLHRQGTTVTAPTNLPVAPEAAQRLGDAWYLRYGSALPHQNTGKIMPAVLQDYLIPWWRGGGPSSAVSTGGGASSKLLPAALALLTVLGVAATAKFAHNQLKR